MNWKAGDSLKQIRKAPITREQLHQYAEASGDDNPIHLEDEVAKAQGLPSVIVHGMISMAFLADEVRANFPQGQYDLINLRTRFRKVTFPGDELTCGGEIRDVAEEGRKIIATLWVTNQKGERLSDGEAILRPR